MAKSWVSPKERMDLQAWWEALSAEQKMAAPSLCRDLVWNYGSKSQQTEMLSWAVGSKLGSCSETLRADIDTLASTGGTRISDNDLPQGAYKRHFVSVTEDALWWVVDHQNGPHEWTQRIRKVEAHEYD